MSKKENLLYKISDDVMQEHILRHMFPIFLVKSLGLTNKSLHELVEQDLTWKLAMKTWFYPEAMKNLQVFINDLKLPRQKDVFVRLYKLHMKFLMWHELGSTPYYVQLNQIPVGLIVDFEMLLPRKLKLLSVAPCSTFVNCAYFDEKSGLEYALVPTKFCKTAISTDQINLKDEYGCFDLFCYEIITIERIGNYIHEVGPGFDVDSNRLTGKWKRTHWNSAKPPDNTRFWDFRLYNDGRTERFTYDPNRKGYKISTLCSPNGDVDICEFIDGKRTGSFFVYFHDINMCIEGESVNGVDNKIVKAFPCGLSAKNMNWDPATGTVWPIGEEKQVLEVKK